MPVIEQAVPGTVVSSGALVTPGGAQGPVGSQGAIGPAGPQGVGVVIKGTVANFAALPSSGNTVGDVWITADTGHGWLWQSNSTWSDIGPVQGPPGPQGATGVQGPQGSQGTQGTTGASGAAATIAAGTTTTTAPGTSATVTNAGSSSAAVFNFGIPRGDVGAQGIQGATGGAGAQGPPGTAGAPGSAATIAVGTTATGAPGSAASVTNTGNSSAAVFNFTVPAGVQGTTGAPGTQGPQGAQGVQGDPGVQGAQGLQGNTGVAGPQGVPGDSDPVGTILMWGTATAPAGWLICDGRAVSRTAFPALFSLLATTFGAGDGSTTFGLPDLRGRTGIGVGTGAGLSNRILAANGGEETHQLTIAELASHTHIQTAHNHSLGVNFTCATGTAVYGPGTFPGAGAYGTQSVSAVNQNTGSDGVHNTMMPFLVLYYIIKASLGGGPTAQAPLADPTRDGLLRQVSGNVTDYVAGDNHCYPLSSISSGGTSHYYDYDDFMGLVSTKFTLLQNGGGSGAVSVLAASTAAYPYGFVQLAPGTVANGYARLWTNGTTLSTRPIIWRALVNLVNITATVTQYVIGLVSLNSAVISTTAYYVTFYCQGNTSANWQVQVRSLTAVTSQDTGVPAILNTWFDLKIVATSTSVAFYVNGTLTNTITTNIPPTSQLLNPSVHIANAADTTNRSIYVDAVEIDVDTGVTGRFMKSLI